MNNNQKIINLILFIALIIFFTIGIILYSSILIYYFAGTLTTIFIISFANKNKKELIDTITILLSVMVFGFILAFMINLDFLEYKELPFRYRDQLGFFGEAKYLASLSSVSELIKVASEYRHLNIIYGLFGLLGYFDKIISGSINFFPLLISVVYVTALIPVFLYHTIKLFVINKIALYGSLYYGLFTPIMAYSGYLLRDMHMALIFMIILFWIVRPLTLSRVIAIIAFMPIIANFRVANLLLILAMLGIYIFTGKSNKLIRSTFILFAILGLIYFSSHLSDTLTIAQDGLDRYEEFTSFEVKEKAGITKVIYSLPPIIKELAIIVLNLSAFPFWDKTSVHMGFPQLTMFFYSTITNIGWFFVFMGIIYFSKPIFSKLKMDKSHLLFYLSILFISYLLVNTANMNLRRVLYVFPFIYIPFLMAYQDSSKQQKTKYIQVSLAVGLFLTVSYLLILAK